MRRNTSGHGVYTMAAAEVSGLRRSAEGCPSRTVLAGDVDVWADMAVWTFPQVSPGPLR